MMETDRESQRETKRKKGTGRQRFDGMFFSSRLAKLIRWGREKAYGEGDIRGQGPYLA